MNPTEVILIYSGVGYAAICPGIPGTMLYGPGGCAGDAYNEVISDYQELMAAGFATAEAAAK